MALPRASAIGLAVADSPDGPWQRVGTDPILKPSADPEQFDSLRIDHTCFVVREGRIWMYYKDNKKIILQNYPKPQRNPMPWGCISLYADRLKLTKRNHIL